MNAQQKLVDRARLIATMAHAGQIRWGGNPYITHPQAVAIKVRHLGPEYEAVAWLHDVLEDTEITVANLFEQLQNYYLHREVVLAVEALTKKKEQSYLAYILNLSTNHIARLVKQADLEHNISTADPKKNKTIIDKWELAKYILESDPPCYDLAFLYRIFPSTMTKKHIT